MSQPGDFGCCSSCLNRNDEWVCEDCVSADGYELDESVIEIDDDGQLRLREELLALPKRELEAA